MKMFERRTKFALLAATPLLALALAVLTQQATAKPPAGNSNNTFAVGGITTVDGHVAFAAQRNPQNGSYSGHVVQDSFGVSRSGPVDCLTVIQLGGGQAHATILWHVTQSDNTAEIGQQRLFEMCDGNGVSPDGFHDSGNSNTDCQSAIFCGSAVIHGNIVVRGP
jgi:hypothetical protein